MTQTAPKVSILVPIYNTETYLGTCLDSLVGQTLKDIEIICINDGSTDSSLDIMRSYSAKDARVRIIDKQNTGYGDSMNQGLAAARGEYIGIVEPDDFVSKRAFAAYVKSAERYGASVVKANYREHSEGSWRDPLAVVYGQFSYNKPFCPADNPAIVNTTPSIWAGLYRRDFILGQGISFSQTPGASFQDASFAHQCWIAAPRVVLLRQGYLHYRIDNQASSSKSSAKVFQVCYEYQRTFDFLRNRGQDAYRAFAPALNAARWNGYKWNYNRISDDNHLAFAQQWAREMVDAREEGMLDLSLLPASDAENAQLLMSDAQEFCNRFPDEIA
ncbi:glycosyltransferase [Denitrobacterium detoxificans]|uniref:glycosyltransferase family 2 protein n=1 Tax=Denitrobacterium detoxificans TaxID=79604 RepID=UPI0026E98A1F|nr:glycosyltransferase [Denitrobacterium detoxificans]